MTPEQLEARTRTLGASDVPAVVGLSPFASSLDVWARKRRGPGLCEPPIVPPDLEQAIGAHDPRRIGQILEVSIADLYALEVPGAQLSESGTLAHREHPWQTATPDRLVTSDGSSLHGLECKLVGRGLMADWADGVPDYVLTQAQWSMHVVGLDRWDVAALIGGTDFRVTEVVRDDEIIASLVDLATRFWEDHVLGNLAPEGTTGRDAKRVLLARWRQDDGLAVDAPAPAETVVRELAALQQLRAATAVEIEKREAMLCTFVGPHKSIKGTWGSFHWRTQQGAASWKSIAEEIAGGAVSADIVDRHRSEPFRVPRLYPHKTWAAAAAPNCSAALAAMMQTRQLAGAEREQS